MLTASKLSCSGSASLISGNYGITVGAIQPGSNQGTGYAAIPCATTTGNLTFISYLNSGNFFEMCTSAGYTFMDWHASTTSSANTDYQFRLSCTGEATGSSRGDVVFDANSYNFLTLNGTSTMTLNKSNGLYVSSGFNLAGFGGNLFSLSSWPSTAQNFTGVGMYLNTGSTPYGYNWMTQYLASGPPGAWGGHSFWWLIGGGSTPTRCLDITQNILTYVPFLVYNGMILYSDINANSRTITSASLTGARVNAWITQSTLLDPLYMPSSYSAVPASNQLGYVYKITGSKTTLVSQTNTTIVTMTLNPGTWILNGQINLQTDAGSIETIGYFVVSIADTSGAINQSAKSQNYNQQTVAPTGTNSAALHVNRVISTTSSQTVYLTVVILTASSQIYSSVYSHLTATRVG